MQSLEDQTQCIQAQWKILITFEKPRSSTFPKWLRWQEADKLAKITVLWWDSGPRTQGTGKSGTWPCPGEQHPPGLQGGRVGSCEPVLVCHVLMWLQTPSHPAEPRLSAGQEQAPSSTQQPGGHVGWGGHAQTLVSQDLSPSYKPDFLFFCFFLN